MVSLHNVSNWNNVYLPLLPQRCPCPAHHCWSDHPDNIWWKAQIIKHLSSQFSPVSCYLCLLKPKCFPQQTLPSHTLNISYEISHTYKINSSSSSGATTSLFESFGLLIYYHTQNNRHHYSSVCSNFSFSIQEMERQEIMNSLVAGIA
jgi:hypothetical protein